MTKVKVLTSSDEKQFEEELEDLLNHGFVLESCNIGFVNSEKYDFCISCQAILVNTNYDPDFKL